MLQVRSLRRLGLRVERLDLADGECAALMGASGSGKSLLLRAIADLDPNDGEVRAAGLERSRVSGPEWRRRVGYLAPESGWWADTVADHFADAGAARALLVRLGLPEDCPGWTVPRLSSGERQRVALARLLVQRPPVLLLDEPTAALDADAAHRVEDLLTERLADGATILLVSHDPAQAERLASRVLHLEDGRLREG